MKKLNHTITVLTLSMASLAQPLSAHALLGGEGRLTQMDRVELERKAEPEMVRWVGMISDDASSHTTDHEHRLEFKKKESQDTYKIKDSPALVQLHHETEKNYWVEIEAEKTPKFLFWGGNLIVKNFKVLGEASGPIPHHAPAVKTSNPGRAFSGRRSF